MTTETGHQIYHNTYSSALEEFRAQVAKRNFHISDDVWERYITFGDRRPGIGKTARFSFATYGLADDDSLITHKKWAHLQVYGMESGRYELNFYIN